MDDKLSNPEVVFVFDLFGFPGSILLSPGKKSHLFDSSNEIPQSNVQLGEVKVQYVHINLPHFISWLKLLQITQNRFQSIDNPQSQQISTYKSSKEIKYFHKRRRKFSTQFDRRVSLNSFLSGSNQTMSSKKASYTHPIILFQITADHSPEISWANLFCNSILSSKIAISAKLEYTKAVNATLGGAYATLQRAGWARLYAKRTLHLAIVSGDEALALRSLVYLKICKIISILHPSYSQRLTYHDDKKGTTTKTDTNVSASEAHLIPKNQRERLKTELDMLMRQAEEIGDDSIIGQIKYAQFRIDSN
jgi:hypothetical protein